MKTHILSFIAMLSTTHPDASAALLESQTLVPSLVVFLSQQTAPIWEDDEVLTSSPATAASYAFLFLALDVSLTKVVSRLRTVSQTLFLIHNLVFSIQPAFNLRHKFQHASRPQFNGIIHIFIVTLGRLSYADAPNWVEQKGREELEQIAGTRVHFYQLNSHKYISY
jgi:hypothetical protein